MKLLVNTPSGAQEIIAIGDGGAYFDSARVIWDERIDGTLPDITLGGMVRTNGALSFDADRKVQHDAATAPAVPSFVTMRQARLALYGAGLLAGVEAAITALPEPAKTAASIEWNYSQEVQRSKGLVVQLGAALGLSPAQIDALFLTAQTL